MNIKELLYNEIIIIKITEFLTILEVQNLIISLGIKVKRDIYFMRECLSLLSIRKDGKQTVSKSIENNETCDNNTNGSNTYNNNTYNNNTYNNNTYNNNTYNNNTYNNNTYNNSTYNNNTYNNNTYNNNTYDNNTYNNNTYDNNTHVNLSENFDFADPVNEAANIITFDELNNNSEYSLGNSSDINFHYSVHENNDNYEDEKTYEGLTNSEKDLTHCRKDGNKCGDKNYYERDTHLFMPPSTSIIDPFGIDKEKFLDYYEIRQCLYCNNNEKEEEGSKKMFMNYWLFLHLRKEVVDIKKEIAEGFSKITVDHPVYRNNEINIDIFLLYKFEGKYYYIFDMPWMSIYYQLCLNAICLYCSAKVDNNSACIFAEKFSLYISNMWLLSYLKELNESKEKNSDTKNRHSLEEKIDTQQPEKDVRTNDKEQIGFTVTNGHSSGDKNNNVNSNSNSDDNNNNSNGNSNAHDNGHNSKSFFDTEFGNADSDSDCGADINGSDYGSDYRDNDDSYYDNSNNNNKKNLYYNNDRQREFVVIRKIHVFCESCTKLLEYRSNVDSLLETIKKDYELLKKIKLTSKTFKIPKDLFCLCNYFFFKDKYIVFFKKISTNLQAFRKMLREKLINNFIFSFTLNFYKFVIRYLLLCDDRKLYKQENIFLFGFYVKYENLLKMFNSPRITLMYFSFNVISKKIQKLQLCYRNKQFLRVSRSLHYDVVAIIEKLKNIHRKSVYKHFSMYMYDNMNSNILSKTSYEDIYNYFFKHVQSFKFS
ncbi:hypothetical protein MKS88_003546 [Plasmodium brasilianum]|uniref:Uncharacterized protein n=2 Tax=Plasmodium (Plasmodium) TaxID=418103 RepID=A0A1A8W3Y3_PLAMA|nr:hypothetical protein MKS88_003546 [Plasmodium brasilianum]SBS86691.1 conserved Plasmodium protein, unknown function [Plasmodium malariae]